MRLKCQRLKCQRPSPLPLNLGLECSVVEYSQTYGRDVRIQKRDYLLRFLHISALEETEVKARTLVQDAIRVGTVLSRSNVWITFGVLADTEANRCSFVNCYRHLPTLAQVAHLELTSMPLAAKRPCRKPGCPELVDSGYCEDHSELTKEADRWRGSSSSRGYDAEWRRVRLQALKRDKYICQHCIADGRVTSAVDVHHVQKLTSYPHLRLVLTNLISLCKGCHAKLTANGQ